MNDKTMFNGRPRPLLGCGLLAIALNLPVAADVLDLPVSADTVTSDTTMALPARGAAQASVLKHYGEPTTRHAAVGGSSAAQPRITRWDYAGFSVIFENDHVVHAVVPDRPAPLFNTDELDAAGTQAPSH